MQPAHLHRPEGHVAARPTQAEAYENIKSTSSSLSLTLFNCKLQIYLISFMMINEALHFCGDQLCSLMFGAHRSCLVARFRSLSLFCVLPNEFKMDPSNRVNTCSGALSLVFGACLELAEHSFE